MKFIYIENNSIFSEFDKLKEFKSYFTNNNIEMVIKETNLKLVQNLI